MTNNNWQFNFLSRYIDRLLLLFAVSVIPIVLLPISLVSQNITLNFILYILGIVLCYVALWFGRLKLIHALNYKKRNNLFEKKSAVLSEVEINNESKEISRFISRFGMVPLEGRFLSVYDPMSSLIITEKNIFGKNIEVVFFQDASGFYRPTFRAIILLEDIEGAEYFGGDILFCRKVEYFHDHNNSFLPILEFNKIIWNFYLQRIGDESGQIIKINLIHIDRNNSGLGIQWNNELYQVEHVIRGGGGIDPDMYNFIKKEQ